MTKVSEKKKVLVLGGTGFIGSAIVNSLISELDKYDVWMLVRRSYDVRNLEYAKIITGTLENFDLKWLDIIKPDIILHLARINGSGSRGRRHAARRGNKANIRLINGIKSHIPETHVIYVSGTLMYGDHGDYDVDEKCNLNPISYAREYVHAETPWLESLNDEKIKVSVMRPPWILGSQSWFGNFFIKYMLKYNQIPRYGNGDNWMSVIDLTDCAGLILNYIESEMTNNVFNVSNPKGLIKMDHFIRLIHEQTGLEVKNVPLDKIVSTYDKATAEAFTFSLRSVSLHNELINRYSFKFLDSESIVKNNLKVFE